MVVWKTREMFSFGLEGTPLMVVLSSDVMSSGAKCTVQSARFVDEMIVNEVMVASTEISTHSTTSSSRWMTNLRAGVVRDEDIHRC